jgi:hypothetical protein
MMVTLRAGIWGVKGMPLELSVLIALRISNPTFSQAKVEVAQKMQYGISERTAVWGNELNVNRNQLRTAVDIAAGIGHCRAGFDWRIKEL